MPIRETFKVSDGFIRKWSTIYAAHLEVKRQKKSYDTKILSKMRFISNRPYSTVCKVRDRIREKVVERRKRYGFEGCDRIKADLKINVSPTTVNKVLREEGALGILKRDTGI